MCWYEKEELWPLATTVRREGSKTVTRGAVGDATAALLVVQRWQLVCASTRRKMPFWRPEGNESGSERSYIVTREYNPRLKLERLANCSIRCPCLTCSIKIVQVGISEVVYAQGYSMDTQVTRYSSLIVVILANMRYRLHQY